MTAVAVKLFALVTIILANGQALPEQKLQYNDTFKSMEACETFVKSPKGQESILEVKVNAFLKAYPYAKKAGTVLKEIKVVAKCVVAGKDA